MRKPADPSFPLTYAAMAPCQRDAVDRVKRRADARKDAQAILDVRQAALEVEVYDALAAGVPQGVLAHVVGGSETTVRRMRDAVVKYRQNLTQTG